MLGISRSQVVPYNASRVYCAGETPTPQHCAASAAFLTNAAVNVWVRVAWPDVAALTLPADRLLVPTPTPRITPPREALQLVQQGLGVQTLPEVRTTGRCCSGHTAVAPVGCQQALLVNHQLLAAAHLPTTPACRPSACTAAAQQAQRDLLIYVSRQAESTRRVANEEQLLAGEQPDSSRRHCSCCSAFQGAAADA